MISSLDCVGLRDVARHGLRGGVKPPNKNITPKRNEVH